MVMVRSRKRSRVQMKMKMKMKFFVLAYPFYINYRCVGEFVTQIENSSLKITEMRCMTVTEDFAWKHLLNRKSIADADLRSLVCHISSNPVFAMIVEGDRNSVKEFTNNTDGRKGTFYISGTAKQATADINLWFGAGSFEVSKYEKVVFMLPEGRVNGPVEQVEEILNQHQRYRITKDLQDFFCLKKMRVFLISPLAFQVGCVGKILHAIESNCDCLRGLTFVKKGDDDECRVAVVAEGIKPCFKIRDTTGKDKIICKWKSVLIDSRYLCEIKAKTGQGVLEAAEEFFDYGFSFWATSHSCVVSGCMFEASLVGLESLK